MIDESRDDGIDNDGDWDPTSDDVGADGLAGTGDAGEGDGVPSPGEPNFDALDVTESDQVGLSSFFYFTPPGALRMNDDARLWQAMTPGFFTTNEELAQQQAGGGVDGDFIFSSGYFRLEPGQTLRFSLATVFGNDLQDITNNTQTIQEIYNRNYQFARPPDTPTLRAVPGDGKVTLFWDAKSLDSIDPVLGMDFEGFRLFKSTDPFFQDPDVVTDVSGNEAFLVPTWQYDLDNGIRGHLHLVGPARAGRAVPARERHRHPVLRRGLARQQRAALLLRAHGLRQRLAGLLPRREQLRHQRARGRQRRHRAERRRGDPERARRGLRRRADRRGRGDADGRLGHRHRRR